MRYPVAFPSAVSVVKLGSLLTGPSSLSGERSASPFIYFFRAGSQIPSASFSLRVLYAQSTSPSLNPSLFPEHLPFKAASAHPGHTFKSLLCRKYFDLAKSFVFSYWEGLSLSNSGFRSSSDPPPGPSAVRTLLTLRKGLKSVGISSLHSGILFLITGILIFDPSLPSSYAEDTGFAYFLFFTFLGGYGDTLDVSNLCSHHCLSYQELPINLFFRTPKTYTEKEFRHLSNMCE